MKWPINFSQTFKILSAENTKNKICMQIYFYRSIHAIANTPNVYLHGAPLDGWLARNTTYFVIANLLSSNKNLVSYHIWLPVCPREKINTGDYLSLAIHNGMNRVVWCVSACMLCTSSRHPFDFAIMFKCTHITLKYGIRRFFSQSTFNIYIYSAQDISILTRWKCVFMCLWCTLWMLHNEKLH